MATEEIRSSDNAQKLVDFIIIIIYVHLSVQIFSVFARNVKLMESPIHVTVSPMKILFPVVHRYTCAWVESCFRKKNLLCKFKLVFSAES